MEDEPIHAHSQEKDLSDSKAVSEDEGEKNKTEQNQSS